MIHDSKRRCKCLETIYTIPIHDAYEVRCGCPICRLERDLEQTSLEYVLGAAMMEPDVRTETNRLGFCRRHFDAMLGMQKQLPLGLILESYTQELLRNLTQPAPGKREFPALAAALSQQADGCFVCQQLHDRLEKFYSNIIHLWLHEPEFRALTRAQPFFCPHHLAGLFVFAQRELSKRSFADFYADHTASTAEHVRALSESVSAFCKHFDYRFAKEPMGGERDALPRTIRYLTGDDE